MVKIPVWTFPPPTRVASLFAGIGGIDRAFEQAGCAIVYANEFERHAADVYDFHFADKVDRRDIITVDATTIPDHDVLVGGFPCQEFSVIGKRRGFSAVRGTLFFDIARILAEKQPSYFVLENVRGLLNHDSGRTFGTILRVLDELGYDCQWQLLRD
jgi:DNA (cytosine-5)-methyltransferase 1